MSVFCFLTAPRVSMQRPSSQDYDRAVRDYFRLRVPQGRERGAVIVCSRSRVHVGLQLVLVAGCGG